MNDTISDRAKKILRELAIGDALSRPVIEKAINETRINTIRELNRLVKLGYVQTSGVARATVYAITTRGRTVVLWNVEEYVGEEPEKRNPRYARIQSELFKTIKGIIGAPPNAIVFAAKKRQSIGDSTTSRKDLERFVIELSWKSSKIEGNTYTLLDTERLIKEAKEAAGHPHDEAVMILNHKKAFDYVWQNQEAFRELTKNQILEIHQLLVMDLDVPFGLREHPVGITGTMYVPPASQIEIASYLHDIVKAINDIEEPIEKAMACLVLLPYLQPFADGNKRTSRLIANAVLLAYGFPPLSYRGVDEQVYKGALILFYEQGSLANIRELYLKQLEESANNYYFSISNSSK